VENRGRKTAAQFGRERLRELDVLHRRTRAAERRRATVRVIDELIGHCELTGE